MLRPIVVSNLLRRWRGIHGSLLLSSNLQGADRSCSVSAIDKASRTIRWILRSRTSPPTKRHRSSKLVKSPNHLAANRQFFQYRPKAAVLLRMPRPSSLNVLRLGSNIVVTLIVVSNIDSRMRGELLLGVRHVRFR
jgi:hypothetical protein